MKQDKLVSKHKVLPPCNTDCRKKCIEKQLPEERKVEINVMFWNLTCKERRIVIYNACKRLDVKRRRSKNNTIKKKFTYKYHLTDKNSTAIEVCKVFISQHLVLIKKMIEQFLTS